jgi:hypothetical protein
MLTICARLPARLRRCAAQSPGGATLWDCSHVKQSQVRHSLTLFLSGIALTQRSQHAARGAVMASQRKSGAGKCSKIKGLRRVRGWDRSRDPPRGWPGGGQDDFDTSTGRYRKFFAARKFLLKNFCIVSNIYPHVCSSCIVKFDYVIANLLTSTML